KGVEETRNQAESRHIVIDYIERYLDSIKKRQKGPEYLERIKSMLPQCLQEEIVTNSTERKEENEIEIVKEKTMGGSAIDVIDISRIPRPSVIYS
ncbi:hypothetical protein PFISCL1PPCAC_25114, partial [Pristionchus fissidentatus]